MDDHTPDSPERRPDADTANPHRAEPVPAPQEGLRPESDASIVRPESDEPNGPVGGLLKTAAAEAAHGAPGNAPEAEAQMAYLGVEEEGVESSQIFGLLLATVASIIALILGVYFIFYLPKLSETETVAEDVPADRYVEQRELRAEAENLLSQYATNADAEGRYRIPITAAMQGVAQAYSGRTGVSFTEPVTRTDFNLSWITLSPAPSVQAARGGGSLAPSTPEVEASPAAPAVGEADAPLAPPPAEPEQ